jgi:hypothetical protein
MLRFTRYRSPIVVIFAALLVPIVMAFPPSRVFSQQSPAKPKKPLAVPGKTPAKEPAKELPMPFRVGETLSYRVSWSAFKNAASVQLSVPEQRNLFGWQTWHFLAIAHTVSPVRTLFPIDDQFDSYTDASTMETRQFEMHLDELGKTSEQIFHFAPAGQLSRAPAPSVVVMPNTRDFLGAAYALRAVDWERTMEFRAPVYSGRDLYEMRTKRTIAIDQAVVPAGTFPASRISVSIFQHGNEVTAIHFEVWIANNAARTPVIIEAQLPFGSLRGELTSVSQ